MNVNLHIERLVLDGVEIAPNQRQLLRSAIETELSRLLTAGGVAAELASGGAVSRVAGSSIQLQGSNGARELGRQIASAVYGGIGK